MIKVDYKKDFRQIYLPKTEPVILDIPRMHYITVCGEGDPNKEQFAKNVEALYTLSFAVKMSYKSNAVPEGYYEYTVFPLEGVWDIADHTKSEKEKDNLKYKLMIRQPDFLTDELFAFFLSQQKSKKPQFDFENVNFECITEGLCCQMMHIGSYDDEPASFERMRQFCSALGFLRCSLLHKEIYISDPRKTEASKRKTVLRFKVIKIE